MHAVDRACRPPRRLGDLCWLGDRWGMDRRFLDRKPPAKPSHPDLVLAVRGDARAAKATAAVLRGLWNPNRHITARDGRVICLAGTFPEGCLGSLRLSRSSYGRNRSRLVFTGKRIADVEFIDEPGLPDAVACQLLQELLKRVEHAGPLATAEPCELLDAMGLRVGPSLMDNPLVAST